MADSCSADISKYRALKIGVLSGGLSPERDISIRSGNNIFNALSNLGINSVIIDVDRNISDTLATEKIDLAFIALHGKYGEDGCIQGLLEIMGIPYTGSSVCASANGMNKFLTKKILMASGIPVPAHVELTGDINTLKKQIKTELGFPVILKPMEEGSSVGVELIHSENEFDSRFISYTSEHPCSFAEKYIKGTELTVGVIGNKNDITVFPILELRPKNEFYDYEAKYTKGMTDFIIPAEIPQDLTEKIKDLSVKGFKALGLSGVARLDLMLDDKLNPYFLEANTIPGFTETSDIPAMAQAVGMSFEELVVKIMDCVEFNK